MDSQQRSEQQATAGENEPSLASSRRAEIVQACIGLTPSDALFALQQLARADSGGRFSLTSERDGRFACVLTELSQEDTVHLSSIVKRLMSKPRVSAQQRCAAEERSWLASLSEPPRDEPRGS